MALCLTSFTQTDTTLRTVEDKVLCTGRKPTGGTVKLVERDGKNRVIHTSADGTVTSDTETEMGIVEFDRFLVSLHIYGGC